MSKEDIFTSLVRVKGDPNNKVISVKSTKPIDKALWREFSKVLSRIYVSTPVEIGMVICSNIMNTGIDIVSTKKISNN